MNEATERAQRVARGQSGTLRVGFTENASWRGVVPDSLHLFRERCPDAELQLHPLPSLHQLEAVRSGRLDAAFMFNPPAPDQELGQLTVAVNSLVLAAPAAHPLSKAKNLRLRDLTEARFIWFPRRESAAFYDRLMYQCVRGGLKSPRIVQEASNEATISGTGRSRHGRRFRRRDRPLAMSGRRGDLESHRPQAVAAIGSRLEKGQPVPAALQVCRRCGGLGDEETAGGWASSGRDPLEPAKLGLFVETPRETLVCWMWAAVAVPRRRRLPRQRGGL